MLTRRVPWSGQPLGGGNQSITPSGWAKGIDFAFPSLWLPNAIPGRGSISPGGSPSKVVSIAGEGASFANNYTNYFSTSGFPTFADGTHYTLMAVAQVPDYVTYQHLINADVGGGQRQFQFRVAVTTGQLEFLPFNTASSVFSGTGAETIVPLNTPFVAIARATSIAEVWCNGKRGSTAQTITGTLRGRDASQTTEIARRGVDGGNGFRGVYYACACWTRALSDFEIAALSANPWQIFSP